MARYRVLRNYPGGRRDEVKDDQGWPHGRAQALVAGRFLERLPDPEPAQSADAAPKGTREKSAARA